MAAGGAPDELPPFEEPEPAMERGLGLSVALGVLVALAAGMVQRALCEGNVACLTVPVNLFFGGGAAGYLANRKGALAGALVGLVLLLLTVVAFIAAGLSYQRATGRPLPMPWSTPPALLRFLAGGLLTLLITTLGGALGLRLRRYIER